jgi:hypothetical protein
MVIKELRFLINVKLRKENPSNPKINKKKLKIKNPQNIRCWNKMLCIIFFDVFFIVFNKLANKVSKVLIYKGKCNKI